MSTETLTAEEFAERLPDLPDGGRWVELETGVVTVLDQSDAAHGTIVLNLSKRLAEYLAGRQNDPVGYACYSLGLIVARDPDTVRRPPVSFFASANKRPAINPTRQRGTENESLADAAGYSSAGLFAETDNLVTESVPQLVVETATNNAVRRAMKARIEDYHRHGVSTVWVADPVDRIVHVLSRSAGSRAISAGDQVAGEPLLPGLSLPVAELFAEPEWWSGGR